MSDFLQITPAETHLVIEFFGEFSHERATQSIDAIIAAAVQHQRRRILFDCSAMTGDVTFFDRYELGMYAVKTRDANITTALFVKHEHFMPNRFFENVAVNRAVDLRVFTDREEALSWLINQPKNRA